MLFIMAIAVAISGYLTLSDSVEEQSRLQQQSMSPAFDLVTEELVKPLHTAQILANTPTLRNLMAAKQIDDMAMLALVKRMSMDYNMDFFVASETSRKQYNANGSTLALKEGQVEWYFRVKQQPKNVAAALGNRQDIHIYFDVKVFNDQGAFLNCPNRFKGTALETIPAHTSVITQRCQYGSVYQSYLFCIIGYFRDIRYRPCDYSFF